MNESRPIRNPRVGQPVSTSIVIVACIALMVAILRLPAEAVPASPWGRTVFQPDGTIIDVIQRGDEHFHWVETTKGYRIGKGADQTWYFIEGYEGRKPILSSQKVTAALEPRAGSLLDNEPKQPDWVNRLSTPIVTREVFQQRIASGETGARLRQGNLGNLTNQSVYNSDLLDVLYPTEPFDDAVLVTGVQDIPLLMILVEYQDVPATYRNISNWSNMIIDPQDPDAKAIEDYYDHASYGAVSIRAAQESHGTLNDGVVGWLSINKNHPNPEQYAELAEQCLEGDQACMDYYLGLETDAKWDISNDAIEAANQYVNFAQYDNHEEDSAIFPHELAIIIVVAGHDAATSGTTYGPSLWANGNLLGGGIIPTGDANTETTCEMECTPVSPNLTSKPGYDGPTEICERVCVTTTLDPVWLVGAVGMGEIHNNSNQATLGVMAHELGHHIFNLPDLYDTDDSSSGIGAFGLMSGGAWGYDPLTDTYGGETPVLPSAWVQFKLDWVNPQPGGTIFPTGRESIPDATPSVGIARVGTASSTHPGLWICSADEYFLMQYRTSVGYDRGLNAWLDPVDADFRSGVAIFHVDETVNTNERDHHRLVDLEEANGTALETNGGSEDNLWHSGDLFDNATIPNTKSNDGEESGIAMKILNPFFNNVNTTFRSAVSTADSVVIGLESACDIPIVGIE